MDGQIGLEPTVAEYVANLVDVFREVWRVLRDDGTLWLNLGDSYAGSKVGNTNGLGGSTLTTGTRMERRIEVEGFKGNAVTRGIPDGLKPKDLIGVPWRVAFALQEDGWYLRSDIIWHKPNPMPESVTDRPTKSHEYLFLLTKQPRYYYDADAVREPQETADRSKFYDPDNKPKNPTTRWGLNGSQSMRVTGRPPRVLNPAGRNKRSVWTIPTHAVKQAHFATFPPALVEPCIKAGSREGDTVLDPFLGAGTTLLVASRLGRHGVGIELNPEYAEIARHRIEADAPMFADITLETAV